MTHRNRSLRQKPNPLDTLMTTTSIHLGSTAGRRIVALLFAITAAAFDARAETLLTGTVSNAATGQNLEGARVMLKGTTREAVTDNQGVYRFDDVTPGSAVLQVSYTGLQTIDVPVQV